MSTTNMAVISRPTLLGWHSSLVDTKIAAIYGIVEFVNIATSPGRQRAALKCLDQRAHQLFYCIQGVTLKVVPHQFPGVPCIKLSFIGVINYFSLTGMNGGVVVQS